MVGSTASNRFGPKGRFCHRWFIRAQRPPGLSAARAGASIGASLRHGFSGTNRCKDACPTGPRVVPQPRGNQPRGQRSRRTKVKHPTSSISAERLTGVSAAMMLKATRESRFGHAAVFQPSRTSFGHATQSWAITLDPDNSLTSNPNKALSCTGPVPGDAMAAFGRRGGPLGLERTPVRSGRRCDAACLPSKAPRGGQIYQDVSGPEWRAEVAPARLSPASRSPPGCAWGWRPPAATATRTRPRPWRRRG